jgi:hypothetical protein
MEINLANQAMALEMFYMLSLNFIRYTLGYNSSLKKVSQYCFRKEEMMQSSFFGSFYLIFFLPGATGFFIGLASRLAGKVRADYKNVRGCGREGGSL